MPNNLTIAREPGAVLARFMELRGRKIVEGCGSLWHSVEGGMLISCPYQRCISPEPGELSAMLRSAGAKGARFPSTTWGGAASGSYECDPAGYDLTAVHPSFRQKVRKAGTKLEVRDVLPDELLSQGMQLNRDTTRRQGRHDPEFEQPASWKRLVSAVVETPGVFAIGAFHAQRLAAYAIVCREDGYLNILHQMSLTDALSQYPNHILTFEITRQAAADPEVQRVCYGLESLVQNPGLHNYKLDFGYDFVRHNSVISLHPLLSFLAADSVRSVLGLIRKRRPRDQRLERIDSVLRTASISRLPVAA